MDSFPDCSRAHMTEESDNAHIDEPFSKRLASGDSKLELLSFDLQVLETYRNDPRYELYTSDFSGHLWVTDTAVDSGAVADEDQIGIQAFGFSHDKELNRAVCVMLAYLARLSRKHQMLWCAHLLEGEYRPHPDFVRPAVYGIPPEGISIFDAVSLEIDLINDISKLLSRQPLFRYAPNTNGKPPNFTFLCRPTKKEYDDFVLTLDKLLSDNIDKAFFGDDVSTEERIPISEGETEIRPKGTITMLCEWLVQFADASPDWTQDISREFRRVRKQRQSAAHHLADNDFDQEYLRKQRDLMDTLFDSVLKLRYILQKLPEADSFKEPEYIEGRKVWLH